MKNTAVKKVLISSKSYCRTGQAGIEILKNAGLTPILNTAGKELNENQLLVMTKDVIGIIAGTEKISKKVILAADKLKVISRYGVGLDNVDLDAAREKNILVFNTPAAPADAVAELTVALILNLLRKICLSDNQLRKGQWSPLSGNLLSGKTVGILGLGRIGKRVTELLSSFGVKFLGYEEHLDEHFNRGHNVEIVPLDRLLKESDIITIHLPLTPQTRHLIGENEFLKMKATAILINTSRGSLVDEKTLYLALKKKIIAGAALDVFDNEPYAGELIGLDNTILTPHIGSMTLETRCQMDRESSENLIKGLKEAGLL